MPGKPTEIAQSSEADVDPELERIRGGDAEQLAAHQAPLDLAALGRRVAGAVRRRRAASRRLEPSRREAVDQLDRLAALREADRPLARGDEAREQARRVAERARADAELGVEQLGVPERDRPLGARRGVAVDHGRRLAEQRLGQLARGSRSSPTRAGTAARRRTTRASRRRRRSTFATCEPKTPR